MSTTAHAASPIVPWAEVVPGAGPVTVDVLLALPDDGAMWPTELTPDVEERIAALVQKAVS